MKTLLLIPPLWQPTGPHLAVPSLAAQLEKANFKNKCIDINIEFYNDLLKKSQLQKSIKKAIKIEKDLKKRLEQYDLSPDKIDSYSIELKELIYKYIEIQNFLKTKPHIIKNIPQKVEKAVSILKNKKDFYNPELFLEANRTIIKAFEIISLPYAPTKIKFDRYINPLCPPYYEDIKHTVFSESTNIFREYYKKWIPKIKREKAKLIGISIGSFNQVVPGLTLASILKQETDAHISIGGNHFTRTKDSLYKTPEFFDIFADSLSLDEGEHPIVELARYINNEQPIEKVPNIMYKKENEIKTNEICESLKLNDIAIASYKNFNFKKYFSPEIALPIQTHRGCYWSKCTFCDIPYGKKFNAKDINLLIEEIKYYNKKYKITTFDIIDESLPAPYLEKLAERIIEEKLNISYSTCARTELAFTQEILDKAEKSGLRLIMWGLESGSERVLNLINKGVDFHKRFEVLKRASDAKIWNHCHLFFGFPTETFDEAKESVDMIENNIEYIHSCGSSFFVLPKNSAISKDLAKFEVELTEPPENNLTTISLFKGNALPEEKLREVESLYYKVIVENQNFSMWRYIPTQHHLFLYLAHHGSEWMKNYKIKQKQI